MLLIWNRLAVVVNLLFVAVWIIPRPNDSLGMLDGCLNWVLATSILDLQIGPVRSVEFAIELRTLVEGRRA